MTKIAIVQRPPALLDRDATMQRAVQWTSEAATAGATLVIFDPQGKLVAGPFRREVGILYADIDLDRVAPARRTLDVTGHYARPDIFELNVRRTAATPVRYLDARAEPQHAAINC